MNKLQDFTRGGQTTLHTVRMLWQVIRWLIRIYLICVALIFIYSVAVQLTPAERSVVTQYYWIEVIKDFKSESDLVNFKNPSGFISKVPASVVLSNPDVLKDKGKFIALMWTSGKYSGVLGIVMLMGFLIYFQSRGRALRASTYVRGGEVVSSDALRGMIKKHHPSEFKLCDIPYPRSSETLHTFFTGGPGQGKTVAIKALIDQIREKNHKAIIYDKMGVYVKEYYNPETDIILNPLDARSPAWSIFSEGRNASDYDTIAAALMPIYNQSQDPFWVNAARAIFSSLAFKMHEDNNKDNAAFLRTMLNNDVAGLGVVLKGTPAESLVNEKSDKTAISVLSVLATYVRCLQHLPTGSENPFSIRRWVEDSNEQGVLFVTSRADQHETLKPLISTWLDIAVNQLLSLDQSVSRRFWVILDELPTLHKLPSLKPGLAETRQFGGAFVLSVQTIAQLREIYGRDGADAISGLCASRLVFNTPESETAEWASKTLGRIEAFDAREGLSYGASEIRDGVSLSKDKTVRPLILDAEIQRLNPLEGYLKFSGNMPVAKVKLKCKDRKEMAVRFVARENINKVDDDKDEQSNLEFVRDTVPINKSQVAPYFDCLEPLKKDL